MAENAKAPKIMTFHFFFFTKHSDVARRVSPYVSKLLDIKPEYTTCHRYFKQLRPFGLAQVGG